MAEVLERPIEIFYAGNHVDSQGKKVPVTDAQIAASVADFNASGERLPMVPGHPGDDAPAGAYATKLAIVNGRVKAIEAEDIDPMFKAIVNSGELNRVSVKLQLPGHPSNPTGNYRFKHIGFLGRSRPALDQLKSAQFSSNDGEIILMADDDKSAEFAEREAEFARREAELEAKMAAFARQQKFEPFIEGLVREGKIAPAQKDPMVRLFCALPEGDEATFAAADGSQQSLVEFAKSFVSGLPKTIDYGEFSKPDKTEEKSTTASFMTMRQDDDEDEDDDMKAEKKMHEKIIASGVDPKDPAAYAAAMKKMMGGKK